MHPYLTFFVDCCFGRIKIFVVLLDGALAKVIVNAQERLIYCANSVLANEVLRFNSTPEDLDYPVVSL